MNYSYWLHEVAVSVPRRFFRIVPHPHRWKFNGGNPVCLRCGRYERKPVNRVYPVRKTDDGGYEIITGER